MKEKYCLDSIVTFQTLNQSPTNRSATKQTFSFSKSPRFEAIRAKYFIAYTVVPTAHTQAKRYCVKTQVQAWVSVRNMISLTKPKKHPNQGSITSRAYFNPIVKRKEDAALAQAGRYFYFHPENRV